MINKSIQNFCLLLLGSTVGMPSLATGQASNEATGTVTGVVVDAGTGLTLAGAEVAIKDGTAKTVTRSNGSFILTRVSTGAHSLVIKYIGYSPATISIEVGTGITNRLRVTMNAMAFELQGIDVVGQRTGQAAALNQQLNALNITNVVAADQIGRFPDANIGDALKRIPGIAVQVDQGEARFGIIRGTEPRLNSITLNGERIPSAEAEGRSVQLDLIPADMVAAIEVNKVITPDMDADAIGASVNVVTRSAPVSPRLSLTAGSGYNLLSEKGMVLGSAVFAQRFSDDRVGIVLNGSYFDHQLGSDDVEAEWSEDDGSAFVEGVDLRRYDIQRVRRSIGASIDYRLGLASTITYRGLYNHRDDYEGRFRTEWVMDEPDQNGVQATSYRKQLKFGTPDIKNRRREDQRTSSHSLSGEHILSGATINWTVQYARASEKRPNERYIEFRNGGAFSTVDLSDPGAPFPVLTTTDMADPENLELKEITEEFQFTKDIDKNARLDLTFPFGGGTSIKVGGRYRDKQKLRDNNFFEYEPINGIETLAEATTDDVTRKSLAGDHYRYGLFPTPTWGGELDLSNPSLFEKNDVPEEYAPSNFDAAEKITAGYIALIHPISPRTTILAGVRMERTSIDYNGFAYNIDDEIATSTTGTQDYTNFFPSITLRYELGERSILRAAWSNTIARPNYYDLVPYREVSFEDDELSIGNPALNPTKSMNFDLMYETYFANIGILSVGGYYKDISDFIYGYTQDDAVDAVTGQTFSQISQPQNGASASLYGFEVSFQRQIFGPISFYGNYSFTESSVDGFPIANRANEDLPLPGTSKHVANVSISYDTRRLQLRASLNFQDDFLDPDEGVGDSPFFDRWYDRSTRVDVNGELTINPVTRFFFEANNLTNQPLRYYQGVRSRTMQAEYYNARFQAGFKLDLR